MTAHAHDHSTQAIPTATGSARPRWLIPALVGGAVVGALVVFGVLSPSVVLYGGLIGGMVLMHAGGHGGHGGGSGQGGHGGHGGGPAGPTSDDVNLSRRSPGSQPSPPGSGEGPSDRAPNDPNGSETHDHDQRSSHSSH
jgi:hypothetical protein